MDRIQFSLHSLTCFLLILAAMASFHNYYRKRLLIWMSTGVLFLAGGINKILGLSERIGSWLLADGIGFINFVNRTLPWLKLYKQPGFVVDFVFLILGVLVVLALHKKVKGKDISYSFFFAGVVLFMVVVGLGFFLATVMCPAVKIVVLQFTKDIFEVFASISFFLCFLTYLH